MSNDRPYIGILLMLGFCVMAPIGDAMAKVIGDAVPIGQLVVIRFAVQLAILAPIVYVARSPIPLDPRILALMAARAVLHILGIGAMFLSLRYLPLADAVAIAFVMPFIMLLLGRTFLNEEVGWRRLAACAVGFCGTLLVVQPSFANVGAPALLPLLVALVFSLFMLVTRALAQTTDAVAMQAISGAIALVILAPVMVFGAVTQVTELSMVMPTPREWTLLGALGVLGTLAHLVMTWSLRYAPASTVAPVQYLEIPVATLVGWVIFRDLPNGMAAVGIIITIAAGLYILLRERALSRASAPALPGADGQ